MRLALGPHGADFELEGLVAVFRAEADVVAGRLFFGVGLFGFGAGQDLTVERFLAVVDRDFRETGARRHREGVDRFEVGRVGIEEGLQDLRLGEPVVDGHVDLVGADLNRSVAGPDRSERATGVGRARAEYRRGERDEGTE